VEEGSNENKYLTFFPCVLYGFFFTGLPTGQQAEENVEGMYECLLFN
jgi:hypothetical protein